MIEAKAALNPTELGTKRVNEEQGGLDTIKPRYNSEKHSKKDL